MDLATQVRAKVEKLGKWRALYAGWWFGTRPNSDPQAQAARDNFDRTIMLRCEVDALVPLLIRKGVFTDEEYGTELLAAVERMDGLLEAAWPGFRTEPAGLVFADMLKCAETMREKGFPG
jgi:hypothetical protein